MATLFMIQRETFGLVAKPTAIHYDPWVALGTILNERTLRNPSPSHTLIQKVCTDQSSHRYGSPTPEIMALHLSLGFRIEVEAVDDSTFYKRMIAQPITIEGADDLKPGDTVYAVLQVDHSSYGHQVVGYYGNRRLAASAAEASSLPIVRDPWDADECECVVICSYIVR